MPVIPAGGRGAMGCSKIQTTRSSSATHQVQSQPGAQETLSLKSCKIILFKGNKGIQAGASCVDLSTYKIALDIFQGPTYFKINV